MGHEFELHLWMPPHAVANLPPAACLRVQFAVELTRLQIFIIIFFKSFLVLVIKQNVL